MWFSAAGVYKAAALGEGEESPLNSSLKRSPEIHIYEIFNIAKFKKGLNALGKCC